MKGTPAQLLAEVRQVVLKISLRVLWGYIMLWREGVVIGFSRAGRASVRAFKARTGKVSGASFLAGFAVLFALFAAPWGASAGGAAPKREGLELEKVADLINVISAANREAYSQIVVNRLMVQEKVIKSDEHYAENKALLLPTHFFRVVSEIASKKDSRAVYSLESFWAIRPQNLPKTELEKIGLAKVLGGTEHFFGTESADGSTYFIATYPDVATSESCVRCHNNHPGSRRQDFKIGDVMGGLVVRIPLVSKNSQGERKLIAASAANGSEPKQPKMSYRDVADLVNSIVAANREAYSSLIVDRLASKEHVIAADERYIEKKCLPLPEQLFSLGALLANGKTRAATYGFRSHWALNKGNLPASDTEKKGLAAVAAGKDRFYGIEASGPVKTLVAVYPDRAVREDCVACHNRHPNSSRRDLKVGDLLGGVVVRVPMTN